MVDSPSVRRAAVSISRHLFRTTSQVTGTGGNVVILGVGGHLGSSDSDFLRLQTGEWLRADTATLTLSHRAESRAHPKNPTAGGGRLRVSTLVWVSSTPLSPSRMEARPLPPSLKLLESPCCCCRQFLEKCTRWIMSRGPHNKG